MTHSHFCRIARHTLTLLALALATVTFAACEDEESDLGIDLTDPSTLYQGYTDTLYPDAAWSQIEDSLLTSGYSYGIIGNLSDPVFGRTSAVLFSRVTLPSETSRVDFGAVDAVDSVILSLVVHRLHPDTSASYRLRFEVMQLEQPVESDKRYYSTDQLPVNPEARFFDDYVQVGIADSIVRLKLNPSVIPVLTQPQVDADSFATAFKGLRIRIADGSDNGMVSIDFSSTATGITAYYHYTYDNEYRTGEYNFLMGAGTAHFTQFQHDYTGTTLASSDSIDGANRLYLEPLGGHAIHLRFNAGLQDFRREHPYAVIHHAELLLPLAAETGAEKPEQILAFRKVNQDSLVYINDLLDLYTLRGYDGAYHSEQNHFRMRVTQHLQTLLRTGSDNGIVLLIDARRHTTASIVACGTSNAAQSPKIVFVYSE